MSYEVKHEEKWFLVSNMEISKKKKLHFRETKKDPCLPFYFHVLNLFKSWSNLGFDQDSNGQKIKKKCVCPSSETRRKRDHSEGEKKGENYGVSPFSGDDVDFCAGFVSEQEVRASERASERVERGRE